MNATAARWLNQVPEVTLSFWVIKIMSTTVGETGADYLAVDAGFGAGWTSIGMAVLLATALFCQMRTKACTPWIYWLTVVLVSIVGTQITDILTDKLDVSLYTSTAIFSVLLAINFMAWYRTERSLSIREMSRHGVNCFIGPRCSALSPSARRPVIWRPKPWAWVSPWAQ